MTARPGATASCPPSGCPSDLRSRAGSHAVGVAAALLSTLLPVLLGPAPARAAEAPPASGTPAAAVGEASWWGPGPGPLVASGPTAPARDGVWPLAPRPRIVEGFDPPASLWGAGHRGVDLAGSPGAPVRSSLPGRVSFSGRVAGRGVVVVDHGGVRTTYQPVAAQVRVGEEVRRGDVVGTLRLAGSHCLPAACLHWGLRRGEAYLDPLVLVGGGPVRLLPVAPGTTLPVW